MFVELAKNSVMCVLYFCSVDRWSRMERCEVFSAGSSVVISRQTLPTCHLRTLQRAILNYSLTSSLLYATAAFTLSAAWCFYLKYLLSHGLSVFFYFDIWLFFYERLDAVLETGHIFLITYVELLKPSSGYSKKTNELNLYNWFNSITSEFCVILQSCIHTFEHHFNSQRTCGRANQQKGERNDAFDLSKGQTLDWILLRMDFPCSLVLKTAEAFYPFLSLYTLSEVRESFGG